MPKFDIVILTGGKGSRMGFKDKGLLEVGGKSLMAISYDLAQKNSENIFISCNQNFDFYNKFGIIIKDELADFQGPLAGIGATLNKVKNEFLLVLPVDCPNLNQEIIDRLVENMNDKTDICVAFDGENIHPTIMLFRTKLKDNLQQFLKRGERKLGQWIRQNNYQKVSITDKNLLLNLNYPQQLK